MFIGGAQKPRQEIITKIFPLSPHPDMPFLLNIRQMIKIVQNIGHVNIIQSAHKFRSVNFQARLLLGL